MLTAWIQAAHVFTKAHDGVPTDDEMFLEHTAGHAHKVYISASVCTQ